MKKLILAISFLFIATLCPALAGDQEDALKFFNDYIEAANTYNPIIPSLYHKDAKIIRQVVKTDGTTANAYTDTDTYMKQLKLGQAGARLRKYKNTYTNIKAEKVNTGYKISSLRQPSGEDYKLKAYMIVTKQPDGKWLITEEMMQTKVQTFLKYAEKQ